MGLGGSSFPRNGLLSQALLENGWLCGLLWPPKRFAVWFTACETASVKLEFWRVAKLSTFWDRDLFCSNRVFIWVSKDCRSCLVFLLGLSISSSSSTLFIVTLVRVLLSRDPLRFATSEWNFMNGIPGFLFAKSFANGWMMSSQRPLANWWISVPLHYAWKAGFTIMIFRVRICNISA